jgi:arylsulfatase A-like enzyme
MKKLKDEGLEDNTILVFTTDNGAENFTWPDGGNTPFSAGKGTVMEGGMRVPMIIRWPGKIAVGKVENGIMSGLDFFPTLVAAAGNPNIKDELVKGQQLGDTTYKVHLDGYNQLDFLLGKEKSNRHEVFYFAEGTLGAVRIDDWKFRMIDQPEGWLGGTVKLDWPILSNLRLDPFERMQFPKANNGSFYYVSDFYTHEFWRFVFLQQKIGEYAPSFIEFPPMQKGASFNLDAVKAELEERIKAMKGKME